MRVSTTHDELPNTNGRLTDVAVNMVLDIHVIRPKDGVHSKGEVLKEEPEAKEGHAEIPFVAYDTSQQDE